MQSVEISSNQFSEQLLALIGSLCDELRPGHHHAPTLDSRIERDLGLDSLARVELIARIERHFSVRLPEDTFARAETVRDLLRALAERPAQAADASPSVALSEASLTPIVGRPDDAETLLEVLDWHVRLHPERTHVSFYSGRDQPASLTYGELKADAQRLAAGLLEHGLQAGESVGIMLPTSLDFFRSFFAVLLAGGVPVPLYPPARLSQLEDHLLRQARILTNALAPILITVPEARAFIHLVKAQVESLKQVLSTRDLTVERALPKSPALKSTDVALLQYTSGSTGNPKGVVLTHGNLLANIRAWSQAVELQSTDVCVSWLPLYHDMGLIGAWLGSLYNGGLLVVMSPLDFLARPERWLWAIHRHRGTVTAAPNFAFELCVRRIEDSALQGLDLSSWRLAANGAEPVSPDTIERFIERFSRYRLRPETMVPVYGLAECSVGLTVPPLGRSPVIDRVAREEFMRSGYASPAASDDPHALRFVACGRPLPGHAVRIVGTEGQEHPDRRVGRIEFRGPSATSGYIRNPEETKKLFHGTWLDSGDLGYLADGDLYVTSRVKDMIIRGGHNLYPYELEEAIGDLPGIRKGCVAVFGSRDPVAQTERLIVVAETRERESPMRDSLRVRINALSLELLGTPPDDIVLAPPHAVLKTSSGKIRRAATRERYEEGNLELTEVSSRVARWRLATRSLWLRARQAIRRLLSWLFSAYAWSLFSVATALVVPLVLILPRVRWRWALSRAALRLVLWLIRIPIEVRGLDRLPSDSAYVLVANHASYLDGLVLLAVLPCAVTFTAKQELMKRMAVRILLHAIGVEYVERFDPKRGVEDAQHLADLAKRGTALAFFPEGTLRREPGLASFHMGAFVVAVQANIPVVPATITGTRFILPDGRWSPRRGAIKVTFSEPIHPQGSDWEAGLKLRDAARTKILEAYGEPDLA